MCKQRLPRARLPPGSQRRGGPPDSQGGCLDGLVDAGRQAVEPAARLVLSSGGTWSKLSAGTAAMWPGNLRIQRYSPSLNNPRAGPVLRMSAQRKRPATVAAGH
jgi:hypothetical protein